ncbi:MAG: magnesium chelatase [Halobacteriales archaeon SW_9_67_25]|nr:MAG: magnesium chelatase [Halobacteriales archaeon SW_9_67_25]
MVESRRVEKASGGLPFSAVVGQDELKEALLAVVADDGLDGLLIRGEKGTAKSTAVRALAKLLPEQRAVADCPYGCPPGEPGGQCVECRERSDPPVETRPVPLVTLPLGATRERVVGTLSVADALAGDYEFEPGLLARANRGILYVDEVNLLDDHLVDVILDAAASGTNRVERDAVSVAHPARFTLVGTMNPEEGELRPQLRDRFALQATVTACEDLEDRVTIVERALGRDGESTIEGGGDDADDAAVRDRLVAARERLDRVDLPQGHLTDIAKLCTEAGVEGHRGDIATARAARAFAALDGRETVLGADVRRAAELALPHRLRSRPFEDAPDPEDVIADHFDDGESDATGESSGEDDQDAGDGQDAEGSGDDDSDNGESEDGSADGPAPPPGGDPADGDRRPASQPEAGGGESDRPEASDARSEDGTGSDDGTGSEEGTPLVPGQSRSPVAEAGESRAPALAAPDADGGSDARPGSRARTEPAVGQRGPRVRTTRAEGTASVEAAASVRAAATRGSDAVESRDLRASVRAGETGTLVVFAVDASASMRAAMRAAKGTVLELLEDAYQQRDGVAVVAFAGEDAEVLLPPTDSVTLAARHLKDLPTGDRTPLPAGLATAGEVLDRADPAAGTVVLVTDGRTNAAADPVADPRAAARDLAAREPHVLVVDAGDGDRAALTELVVSETGAERVSLDALSAERVDAAAGRAREN